MQLLDCLYMTPNRIIFVYKYFPKTLVTSSSSISLLLILFNKTDILTCQHFLVNKNDKLLS